MLGLAAVRVAGQTALLAQGRRLTRIPLGVPFWAYTFPLAAASAAAVVVAADSGHTAYVALAWVLLIATSLVVVGVFAMTVRAALRREICVPE